MPGFAQGRRLHSDPPHRDLPNSDWAGNPGAPCNAPGEVVVVTTGAVFVGLVVIAPVAVVCGAIVVGELDKGVVAVRADGAVERTAAPWLVERLAALEPCDCAIAGVLASRAMVNRLAVVRRLGIFDLRSFVPPLYLHAGTPCFHLEFPYNPSKICIAAERAACGKKPCRCEPARAKRRQQDRRVCKRCDHTKPIELFKKSGTGRGHVCKVCDAERARKRWRADIEASRAKRRARRQRNLEQERAQGRERARSERGRAINRRATARYRRNNPEIVAAQAVANKALRRGELRVALVCEVRGCLSTRASVCNFITRITGDPKRRFAFVIGVTNICIIAVRSSLSRAAGGSGPAHRAPAMVSRCARRADVIKNRTMLTDAGRRWQHYFWPHPETTEQDGRPCTLRLHSFARIARHQQLPTRPRRMQSTLGETLRRWRTLI